MEPSVRLEAFSCNLSIALVGLDTSSRAAFILPSGTQHDRDGEEETERDQFDDDVADLDKEDRRLQRGSTTECNTNQEKRPLIRMNTSRGPSRLPVGSAFESGAIKIDVISEMTH